MSEYTVRVVRADADDKAWTVTVDGHPQWSFREKNFAAVEDRVRELARIHDGVDPAAVTVIRAQVRVGVVEVTDRLADLDELRRRAQQISAQISATTAELITALRRQAGLSTRDTGAVLGLTGARINQLEQPTKADTPTEGHHNP